MTSSEVGSPLAAGAVIAVAPESADDSAGRPTENACRRRLGARGAFVAVALLIVLSVRARESLLRTEVLDQRPRVDPEFVGLGVGVAAVVLVVGFVVVFVFLMGIGRLVDGIVGRDVPNLDHPVRLARWSVSVATVCLLTVYVLRDEPSLRIGAALPLVASIPIAAGALALEPGLWRAATTWGRRAGLAAVALAFAALTFVGYGWTP